MLSSKKIGRPPLLKKTLRQRGHLRVGQHAASTLGKRRHQLARNPLRNRLLQRRGPVRGIAIHMIALNGMAEYQPIGLRTVYEPESHASIGGVMQVSLALDDVPMVWLVGG